MTKKELVAGIYKRLSKKLGHPATRIDLKVAGVTESLVRWHFGNLSELRKYTGVQVRPPELEAIYEALGVKNGK